MGQERAAEEEQPRKAVGWAARDPSGHLFPFTFSRRATGDLDVVLRVLYCGICHTDLHYIKDEWHTVDNQWPTAIYPAVPGHEIVGEVTEVGTKVRKFKAGDKVGVGCMVGSCRSCDNCANHLENYCSDVVWAYGSHDHDGTVTRGGYSDAVVVDQHFVVRIPDGFPLDAAAPLLCAGITVYSPLKYYGLDRPGTHVGVVGLGGLGHVAVKFAKALGVTVTVISTSPGKEEEAVSRLGADYFLLSSDSPHMEASVGTMDAIIDTVSANHSILPLIGLLRSHGKLILVGAPNKPFELPAFPLIIGRKLVVGSCIGGVEETQEMMDFAAEKGVKADVEVIPIDYVNTAMQRMVKSDVKYRFVIDIANTLKSD